MDSGLSAIDTIKADERIDLEISKVKVNVDGIEANEEIDKGILLVSGNMTEESGGDSISRRERLGNGEIESECLCIYISDINPTLVCEEDRVAFAGRCDANVVFCVRRVRQEGFNDEVV